jgi:hypothetical protein
MPQLPYPWEVSLRYTLARLGGRTEDQRNICHIQCNLYLLFPDNSFSRIHRSISVVPEWILFQLWLPHLLFSRIHCFFFRPPTKMMNIGFTVSCSHQHSLCITGMLKVYLCECIYVQIKSSLFFHTTFWPFIIPLNWTQHYKTFTFAMTESDKTFPGDQPRQLRQKFNVSEIIPASIIIEWHYSLMMKARKVSKTSAVSFPDDGGGKSSLKHRTCASNWCGWFPKKILSAEYLLLINVCTLCHVQGV